MIRAPSSDATTACSSRPLPATGCAMAPIGIWQPPPSVVTTARSAASASEASASFTRATASRVVRSPARTSIAMMPWPGAGTHSSSGTDTEIRAPNPSRRKPAAASTRRSYSPASSFLRRVSRLPRTFENRAPGNRFWSCAMRRTLPVPIRGAVPGRGPPTLDSGLWTLD